MEGYMNNLLSANISNATAWGTILVVVLVIFLVIFFAIIAKFFKTWLRARLAKAPVSMSNMLGMWLRKVPYPLVVDTRITAAKAGLDISTDELEAHFLAGGDIVDCVLALIAAEKAGIPLSYDRACAIDLAVKGTSKTVLEAVRTSINPRVIDCPNPSSGQTRLTAVARDGIAVAVRARVTVRTNLDLFVGGATEETVVARVGEGIVSAVGSAPSYKDVLEKPEVISRTVSDKGVDAATAFEVLSIDIADVDVAGNVGARLQAEQAEADKQIAQAKAEVRRAAAVATEQEMAAKTQEMRAKVVEAEAQIPMAMAEAFRNGNLEDRQGYGPVRFRITGVAMSPKAPERPIDCGNSGTGMRLLAGMLAACPFDSEMFGDASLSSRPMGRIMQPLEQMGARIEARGTKPGCAPLSIHGGRVHPISYALVPHGTGPVQQRHPHLY